VLIATGLLLTKSKLSVVEIRELEITPNLATISGSGLPLRITLVDKVIAVSDARPSPRPILDGIAVTGPARVEPKIAVLSELTTPTAFDALE
jgi:hypothetical protein